MTAPNRLSRSAALKPVLLRLYRLGVVVLIVWIVREHHTRLRIDGDRPIEPAEVKKFLPQASRLETDHSTLGGLHVSDADGRRIGYVLRTSPVCDGVIGYCGPTDTLIALDAHGKVIGAEIRDSWDTREHVGDVRRDRHFLKTWNAMPWERIAAMDLKEAGVEGVSGSTLTSMGIARSMVYRFAEAAKTQAAEPPLSLGARDVGLVGVVAFAALVAFTPLRGQRYAVWALRITVIGYIGLINGDLISQSLLMGWARSGVPWRLAPGLVLLTATALIVPWSTRRQLYCAQICPHGAAQACLGRLMKRKPHLPRSLEHGLRWLPPLTVVMVLAAVMLALPLDLADIEPFDAYLLGTAGAATILIAVVGLAAALFVALAYCRYGCPTGQVLEFVRSHGRADRFGRRDVTAGLMLLMVGLLHARYDALHAMLIGPEKGEQSNSQTQKSAAAGRPALGMSDPDAGHEPVLFSGRSMGTSYTLQLAGRPAGADFQALHAALRQRLEQIEQRLSTWRDDSEISRFNRYDGREWFAVSDDTAAVVAEALAVSELTDGAFDVTLAPLVRLWGFGPGKTLLMREPSQEQIERVRQSIGYKHLRVRSEPPALRKTRPGLTVDLSALAMGYAIDELAKLLDAAGIGNYLIELGGAMKAGSTGQPARAWHVGIATPLSLDANRVSRRLDLIGSALSTSGDYRNCIELDGRRYSHILDPRTGRPAEHDTASVSVIDPSAMRADAMDTALMVLGPDAGFKLARRMGLDALFLVRGHGSIEPIPVGVFARSASPDVSEIWGATP